MFLVLLLYALFASVFIIEKTSLHYAEPLFLVGSRMILAGLIMLAYQGLFHRQSFQFRSKHIWMLVRLAVFNIYLTNIFEFLALRYLDSFKTCFIYNLSPFTSALFSYFVFSEKLSWKKWLGLSIGVGGFIPILLEKKYNTDLNQMASFISWAEIAMLLAVVCSVYGWILLRQLVRDEGCSFVMANGISMLIGGIMALGHSFLVEDWNPLPVTNYAYFFASSLLLMLVSNLICYNLYGALLKKFSATFMSFAGFTTPLFTALFGWLFLGEVITLYFYVSAIIVFFGLLIFSQEELQEYRLPSNEGLVTSA